MIVGGGARGLADRVLHSVSSAPGASPYSRRATSGPVRPDATRRSLRSNYKTPEGARFYDESIHMYERLSAELDFNLLFSQCGHLTLAHSVRAMFVMANRAVVNRLNGIDSRLASTPAEVSSGCAPS